MSWKNDQKFEADWWSDCRNTYGEEEKQLTYAEKMGLRFFHNGKSPYWIDMKNKSVIDIGAGPCSLLLKCENVKQQNGKGFVVDPCEYPKWVWDRYIQVEMGYVKSKGEDLVPESYELFDEAWIYNCLQHVDNPEIVIKNALKMAKIVRVFEWINNGVSDGHPHDLTAEKLDEWFGGVGKVEFLNQPTLKGQCWYGVFKGEKYE